MRRYKKALIVAGALCRVALCGLGNVAAGEIEVESAQVRLIDDVEVPAQVEGVLKSLDVREGYVVGEGDPIAQLDDAICALGDVPLMGHHHHRDSLGIHLLNDLHHLL